jgi:hypothetical protein
MNRLLRAVALAAGLISVTLATAYAGTATPSSGTITNLTTTVSFTTTMTGANATNNATAEPNCSVPDCADFLLHVNLPAGYTALHPNYGINMSFAWPDTVDDFDIYFYTDASGTTRAANPAATSSDPETQVLGIADGSHDVLVRVVAFKTVNETLTGTMTLGPRAQAPPGLGTYIASADLWSCNKHLDANTAVGPTPPTFDHNNDAEPSMKFDQNGKAYVTGIAGVPAGEGLWFTSDGCGQNNSFYGAPDQGAGGGDTDVETAGLVNALGNYNVYTSSLTLASVTITSSLDNGATHTVNVAGTVHPADDRQWLAAYGANTVWMQYVNIASEVAGTGGLELVRWDNAAQTAAPGAGPFPIWTPGEAGESGNLACDQRPGATPAQLPVLAGPNGEGTLYSCWNEAGRYVYVGSSSNFGVTWTKHLVFDGGVGSDYAHLFTWTAVDNAGNVFVVFSDQRNVYYSFSTDQAAHWSQPVRVSNGNETRCSLLPTVVAGSAGRILIGWYGTSSTTSSPVTNPPQEWHTFVARCNNALDPVPQFEQKMVSDRVVHVGALCESGLNCPSDGSRNLAEDFELGINPVDGSGFCTWANSGEGGVFITRELAGKSSIASLSVPDRTNLCPVAGGTCIAASCQVGVGDPCMLPGKVASCDALNDELSPVGGPGDDIDRVYVAEPNQADNVPRFVISMKMAALDPNNLPPSRDWHVLFTPSNGTTSYYVDMSDCDPTKGPYAFGYGTFNPAATPPTFTPVDSADGGVIHPDGTIEITIAKSKVGNPPVGSSLNAVHGLVQLFAGALCGGLLEQTDISNNGTYPVIGNCQVVATEVERFNATETAGNVDLEWSSTAVGTIRSWNVYRSTTTDERGTLLNAAPIPMGNGGSFSYHDTPGSGTFYYQLGGIRADGTESIYASTTASADAAKTLAFAIAGQNPFRSATMLRYTLPGRSTVRIDVFDVAGHKVRSLINGVDDAGVHTIDFSLRDPSGRTLPAGVYLVRLQAGKETRGFRVVALH